MTLLETRPEVTSPSAAPRKRSAFRRRPVLFGLLGALLLGIAVWSAIGANKTAPLVVAPPPAAALSAHGTVVPAAQATIATMGGGVVRSLAVKVGQVVGDHQLVAEISTAAQTETLVAPWGGTVIGVAVNRGDTLMPGAAVATVADLSSYQVQTNDVDEYLIGQINPNQQVIMTVEALDGRRLEGSVDTVALAQQASSAGVVNYPVVIRLAANDPDLRPGMTVRIIFSPGR
jgi:multidrug efflux pump subunit AcrA (membrane-fusion protein)